MNSISNSFKNSPSHLNHIIPVDFNNILTVPDSHDWTLQQYTEQHPVVEPNTFGSSVPLINLSDPNAKSLIRHACEEWGVFQVTSHGVPMNLLNEVQLQAQRLFSLPTPQKLCALRSPDGITGYGLPRISSSFPKLVWSEGFSIMGSPVEHATQLWPHELNQQTSFCAMMEECQKEMKASTERIMELIFGSLELTTEDVDWFKPKTGRNEAQAIFQLNSYPVCPEPNQTMGLGPHTDTSLLTVLYQSSCSGLQVFRDGIGWIPVQPITGALVVNVGDLMHILSNGRFKSTVHRAVVNKTRHRFSVAYIYGPPSNAKISPLINLTDHDHPPLFCPVTWKEYAYAKAMHFNNGLEIIKNKNAVIPIK